MTAPGPGESLFAGIWADQGVTALGREELGVRVLYEAGA